MGQVAQLKGRFNFGIETTSGTAVTTAKGYPVARAMLKREPQWAWWEGPGSFDREHGVVLGHDGSYSMEGWLFPQYMGYILANAYGGLTEASGGAGIYVHTFSGADWASATDAIQPWTMAFHPKFDATTSGGTRIALGCVGNALTINWPVRDVTQFSLEGFARSVSSGASNMTDFLPSNDAHQRAFVFDNWVWQFGFGASTTDTVLYPKEASLSINNNFQFYYDMFTGTAQATQLVAGKREVNFSLTFAVDTSTESTFWRKVLVSNSNGFFSVSATASTTASSSMTLTTPRVAITNDPWGEFSGSSDRQELTIEGVCVEEMPTIVLIDAVVTGSYGRGTGT